MTWLNDYWDYVAHETAVENRRARKEREEKCYEATEWDLAQLEAKHDRGNCQGKAGSTT